jgi:hypothetical protein
LYWLFAEEDISRIRLTEFHFTPAAIYRMTATNVLLLLLLLLLLLQRSCEN